VSEGAPVYGLVGALAAFPRRLAAREAERRGGRAAAEAVVQIDGAPVGHRAFGEQPAEGERAQACERSGGPDQHGTRTPGSRRRREQVGPRGRHREQGDEGGAENVRHVAGAEGHRRSRQPGADQAPAAEQRMERRHDRARMPSLDFDGLRVHRDVEAVFLFPWAAAVDRYGTFGLIVMLVFIVLLLDGLVYAWKRGLLRWV
jgi:NADH-quinone oxidoreductase subunit A